MSGCPRRTWSLTSALIYSSLPSPPARAPLPNPFANSFTFAHFSSGVLGRSTQYTARAPASTNASAISSPIPRCAPETSATRSASESSRVKIVGSAGQRPIVVISVRFGRAARWSVEEEVYLRALGDAWSARVTPTAPRGGALRTGGEVKKRTDGGARSRAAIARMVGIFATGIMVQG